MWFCACFVCDDAFGVEAGKCFAYYLDIPGASVSIVFRSGFIAVIWILCSLGVGEEKSITVLES